MIIDIVILIWIHFIADFILQTDDIAKAKSTSNKALLIHVVIYSVLLLWFGWLFAIVNLVGHAITDYFTSRTASYFYQNDQRHWFFVTIGFDQAIHLTMLVLTYWWLVA